MDEIKSYSTKKALRPLGLQLHSHILFLLPFSLTITFMFQIKSPSAWTLNTTLSCLFKVLMHELFAPFLIITNFSLLVQSPQYLNMQDLLTKPPTSLDPVRVKYSCSLFPHYTYQRYVPLPKHFSGCPIVADFFDYTSLWFFLDYYLVTCILNTMLGIWYAAIKF